jgi:putative SOS response-associated peptidase YedK
MCGRFTLAGTADLDECFQLLLVSDEPWLQPRPRYNIAPMQQIATVVETPDGRRLQRMQWGFRPGWLTPKAGQPPPINARAETLVERPLFRGAVRSARCLIPADGFCEWQVVPGQKAKQPQYIRLRGGDVFGFAGLYAVREDGDDSGSRWSCAIVTCSPNELMAPIHNRMPVILHPDAERLWLDPDVTDTAAVLPLLQPYAANAMEAYPVGPRVSWVRNDGPELIAQIVAI